MPEAPLIDTRTYGDLVAEVEKRIDDYADKRWQPVPGDAGWALVRIFSRMAELVVDRLNRLPDHSFLAFLDLIGTRLNPPQPARVPLTFLLATGSPVDALVPAGTQASAVALEGEADPPVFATERDLVVTRSQLVAVYSREPGADRWADQTAVATGQTAGTFKPFRGDRPIAHRLYVSHPLLGLPETKTAELWIGPATANDPWPSKVAWSFWNGTAWEPLTPTVLIERDFQVVRFAGTTGFAASTVDGLDGHWLRGQWKPPLLPGEPLLRIDSLSVRIIIQRTDSDQRTVPERGFANQAPLDLTKDFLPFGEKPKISDVFYLAGDEALSKPGAEVDLHVALTNPPDQNAELPSSIDAMLAWELWDGREWRLLGNSGPGARSSDMAGNLHGFKDDTNAFLTEGTVHFIVPPALAAGEVNGESHRWLRVRIAKGGYGAEAKYEKDGSGYKLSPATFQPPSLRSVRLGYSYDSKTQPPQRVLTENDFAFADVAGTSFTPFLPAADLRPTLYLGFERPGAAAGFANRTTALFFEVRETSYGTELEEVTEEASVVWEYWNGEGWKRLGSRDETRGLTRRGLLTFLGPADFSASTELGRTAFWLRGRWERGGYAVEPQLTRVLTNTMWAVHAQTFLDEALGSSLGEPGQVFSTLRAPVLDGQTLEVIEPEIPSAADLAELAAEEGDDAVTEASDAGGSFVEVRVRWHEVPDFYGSGPRSRHYVLDRATGEVAFGDGRRGLIPPSGRDNIRMVRYQAGGGLAGNRPAGSITQLKSTVPYVTGVAQPLPAEGGAAEESLEAASRRGPKALRHRNRAVAAADFEDLAFQASSQVARARALPAGRGSEIGEVCLIVVPAAEVAKPVPSLELLDQVRSYIEARLSPVVDFSTTGPDWLQVDVRAEIVPQQLDAATDLQAAVLARLRAFLHPLSGGPDEEGWDFGRVPHRSDLYALLEDTPGIDHVRRLEVIETPREGGARPGQFLVFSGEHEVLLSEELESLS